MVALDQRTRRFVTCERKSFDLALEGRWEDLLKITENGHRRRSSVVLLKEDFGWIVEVWKKLWRERPRAGWFQRRRVKDRMLLFQINQNRWGRMVVLSVLRGGVYKAVVFPEGMEQIGWREISNATSELVAFAESVKGGGLSGDGVGGKGVKTGEHRLEKRVDGFESTPGIDDRARIRVELCCPGCGKIVAGDFVQSSELQTRVNFGPKDQDDSIRFRGVSEKVDNNGILKKKGTEFEIGRRGFERLDRVTVDTKMAGIGRRNFEFRNGPKVGLNQKKFSLARRNILREKFSDGPCTKVGSDRREHPLDEIFSSPKNVLLETEETQREVPSV